MDNKFNVQAGDVIFRRARNGWIVYTIEGGVNQLLEDAEAEKARLRRGLG
jgi:hypothetical protein